MGKKSSSSENSNSSLDLSYLEEVAKSIPYKEWEIRHDDPKMNGSYWSIRYKNEPGIRISAFEYYHEQKSMCGDYIGTFDPVTILSLINRIKELENKLSKE